MKETFEKSVLQELSFGNKKNGEVFILRDDLIHPFISGNKWRKLKYNVEDFKTSGKFSILTFGGAFSNHLVATAAAGKIFNIPVIGIVRGEEVKNDSLDFMISCGMKLIFLNRDDYRKKDDTGFVNNFLEKNNIDSKDCFIIPEGGANNAGVKGASEIMNDIPDEIDYIICACGTATTISGISQNLKSHQKVIGIPVLKAENYLEKSILEKNGILSRIILIHDYHFGGYAKSNEILKKFCKDFISKTNISIEPVYTGKLMFALYDLIEKNHFPENSKVAVIHSGGVFQF